MSQQLFDKISNFSKKDGLKIQAEQLEVWETILNENVFKVVKKEAETRNKELSDDVSGYLVWRGTEIDNFVYNYALKLHRSNKSL